MRKEMHDRLVCLRNYLLDLLASVAPRSAVPPEKPALLVVRLDAIGDFVLWLDAAAGLRTLYPPHRYRLVLVANALWAELAERQPYFDEVIPVDTGRLLSDSGYRLQTWLLLRKVPWEKVVNPTWSRRFPFDDAVVRVCGARERIGFRGDRSNQRGWEKSVSNRWYTRLIGGSAQPMMELERNAEFLRGIGLPGFRAGLPELLLPAGPVETGGEPYYLMAPSASLALKQWPVEKFAELAQRVWNKYRLKAFICGAPGEEALGLRLQQLAREKGAQIELLAGKTSLTRFAALIRGARVVVANDSSAVHIAAALGTRAVCLVGGGHYGRFIPYRTEREVSRPLPVAVSLPMDCYHCNLHCRFQLPEGASAPCLERIPVDGVWLQVRSVLESS